jgi:hypothetical protein
MTIVDKMQAVLGNAESWKIHMAGIQKMIQIRGGLSTIEPMIQMKLLR